MFHRSDMGMSLRRPMALLVAGNRVTERMLCAVAMGIMHFGPPADINYHERGGLCGSFGFCAVNQIVRFMKGVSSPSYQSAVKSVPAKRGWF